MARHIVQVDVIVPVHNAAETLEETVLSAMHQNIPQELIPTLDDYELYVRVCCYDDGSTDGSWEILLKLQQKYSDLNVQDATSSRKTSQTIIPSRLLIAKSSDGVGRGAGYARNRAAELSQTLCDSSSSEIDNDSRNGIQPFLCLLDSDDVMDSTRVAEQISGMLALPPDERLKTLMGCRVVRDPPESTWHYTSWANNLTEERLLLERFREVTLLQPTWMMCRSRFEELNGYIEAPKPGEDVVNLISASLDDGQTAVLRLIHPTFDTPQTLRLAEDLRFFHAHLYANGLLRLHKSTSNPDKPLLTYRHRHNQSQSYSTSRKLLLHLRALAFEWNVLRNRPTPATSNVTPTPWNNHDGKFVVWGAGRDGKDFVKALSEDARKRVYCFLDVDHKKIQQGYYTNRDLNLKIPIVHFSLLVKDLQTQKKLLEENTNFGLINKSKAAKPPGDNQPATKKQKTLEKQQPVVVAALPQVAKALDLRMLVELPVVVCVAMNRTSGALENNVAAVGRQEGFDLWHFN